MTRLFTLMLLCLLDGTSKPADIAECLDMDIKDVYRIKRRVQQKLMPDYGGESDAEE